MNQILYDKGNKIKLKKIFKFQFVFSIILIIIILIFIIGTFKEKQKENIISNTVLLNAKLNAVFSSNKEIYFGRLKIQKINLDYYIYNNYSEELLKILPCKFSGGKLNENSNVCIIGHNYFDNRFFSNLNKLKIDDEIIIEDLDENVYKYMVYDIYQVNENDIEEVTKVEKNSKILTLCTCTFNKDKRLIVKAKR